MLKASLVLDFFFLIHRQFLRQLKLSTGEDEPKRIYSCSKVSLQRKRQLPKTTALPRNPLHTLHKLSLRTTQITNSNPVEANLQPV